MATDDTIQIPKAMCQEHTDEELSVYCRDCGKAICFQCSREDHKHHKCAGLPTVARQVRSRIPQICDNIRSGPLSRMNIDLKNLQLTRESNIDKYKSDVESLDQLQSQCSEWLQRFFKSRRSLCDEELKKRNESVEGHENQLTLHKEDIERMVKMHQESHAMYGDIAVIDASNELCEITDLHAVPEMKFLEYQSTVSRDLLLTDLDEKDLEKSLSRVLSEGNTGFDEIVTHNRNTIRYTTFSNTRIPAEEANRTCPICMDSLNKPQKLRRCGHIFCFDCIMTYFNYKPACPNCGIAYGKLTGDQPEGSISFQEDHTTHLPGYENSGTITVTYSFPDGRQGREHPSPGTRYRSLVQSGYLPDNREGRQVARLINVAFSRKLVFTICLAETTDKHAMKTGIIVWNDIHHKTRTHGGPERFGYPDPTYIERVMKELAVKGVTEEYADDPSEYKEYTRIFKNLF